MNILAWNIRGCNEPSRVKEACKIVKENNVGIFALLETKVKRDNSVRITKRMGEKWKWVDNYSSDTNGRIVVGWDPGCYKITKLVETNQMIHVLAYQSNMDVSFFVSFIYASNNATERLRLWEDMDLISKGRKEAWLVLGDLNNVMYSYERVGENQLIGRKPSHL